MKKTLFAIAALLCGYQLANAQTQKGTQNLGLNLNYLHASTNATTSTGSVYSSQKSTSNFLNIGPTYSIFITDGMELGTSVAYGNNTQTNNSVVASSVITETFKQTSSIYGASLFLKKYVLYKDQIGFRVGPYAAYTWGNTKIERPQLPGVVDKSDVKQYNLGADLDLVYYPSKKLGLALSLIGAAYNFNENKNGTLSSTEVKNFSFRALSDNLAISAFFVIGAK